jgi:hypothetical protein
MSYRVLVLPESRSMRPELVRKLLELVRGGVTIVGAPPQATPSLMGGDEAGGELAKLVAELWGDLDGASRTIRYVGRGRVVWGRPLTEVLAMLQLPPDVEFAGGLGADFAWLHRRLPETDIYFVANCTDVPRQLEARFRVDDAGVEVWRADTGAREPVSYRSDAGRTVVSLDLASREAVFVMFRGEADDDGRSMPRPEVRPLTTVEGPWKVTFPADMGAPAEIEVAELKPLSEHTEPGVQYFSGTATYSADFTLGDDALGGEGRVLIYLGDVRDLAAVKINGEPLGTLWKPPYHIDVTKHVKAGANTLEVAVTNQWTNRVLGDTRVPPDQRVFNRDAPPRRGPGGGGFGFGPRQPATSGLLGPVMVVRETEAE